MFNRGIIIQEYRGKSSKWVKLGNNKNYYQTLTYRVCKQLHGPTRHEKLLGTTEGVI